VRSGLTPELRLLVAVGFLGAYTTFSSFAVESLLEVEGAKFATAVLNVLVNNGIGLIAAWGGMVLARGIATL
jgi:CrcB protein